MRIGWVVLAALLPVVAVAQDLPMSRQGLDNALAQYFAGADRNHDGRLDRAEATEALGFARSLLHAQRDPEPLTADIAPDGTPRLSINPNGPLGTASIVDGLFTRTDTDGDGMLSLAEVQAAGRARFDSVDLNHDGILDEKERAAAKARLDLFKGMLSGGN